MCRTRTTGAIAVLAFVFAGPLCFVRGASPSQTPEEGMVRAGAEVVKSHATLIQAQASMVNAVSQAHKTAVETRKMAEEIRSMALENKQKTAEVFYAMRAKRAEYLMAHARPRPTKEVLARCAKWGVPKRLKELDYRFIALSSQNNLPWPAIFDRPEFHDLKLELDIAFSNRSAQNCGLGSEVHYQVYRLAKQLAEELKKHIREIPPAEYVAAKRFLDSVVYETRFPPGGDAVARAQIQPKPWLQAKLTSTAQ